MPGPQHTSGRLGDEVVCWCSHRARNALEPEPGACSTENLGPDARSHHRAQNAVEANTALHTNSHQLGRARAEATKLGAAAAPSSFEERSPKPAREHASQRVVTHRIPQKSRRSALLHRLEVLAG